MVELAIRQARERFPKFVKLTFPSYQFNWHHYQLATALEAVERGDLKRVIFTIAPRTGKSEQISVRFPVWYLGKHPEWEVMAASYASELAHTFGRKVRNLSVDPSVQEVFPGLVLAEDSKAAGRWNTQAGGGYFATGIGGPATGRGANLLLIDDPVKNREEANSKVMRDKAYDWFTSVAYTRLAPGGAVILVMTRWHDDDLAGRLIKKGG